MTNFRTRFAPSPTGYLHLGTARTVLHTKLLASANKGAVFYRLEDTDRARLQPEAFENLLDCLYKLNLIPDEGVCLNATEIDASDDFYKVGQKGAFGPYIQSERLEIYHQHAQKLIDKKLCYWSYLNSDERQKLQELKQGIKRPINWFLESSKNISEQELYADVQTGLEKESNPALRFKLQRDSKITCRDELLGETVFDLSLEEDPVFLKADGFPSYHLAHLIDDKLMETTHVIRAQEWYPSLPLHTQMYIDYWGQDNILKYIHLPFILGETGNKKMSKRDGNVNMSEYLEKGFLPEAIINYLAFLGWNPGTEQELFLKLEDFV